ncbi:MAG: alpha/beta hydrolase [Microbacteriaceae bacterium]|nr:alpha/beta hydrolase [Microbacteriaceae bacterium]
MTAPAPAWPHLYREGSPGSPVLLMLHGTGGNEHDFAALAKSLDPSAAVLAPRGPVQERGMLRWFHRFAEGQFDVDDVVRRSGELAAFIAEARAAYGLGDRRLIAIGFSNGANIALATALLHPQSIDRVIAFSGMNPLPDREVDTDLSGSRVLLLNGDSDPFAPLASAKRVVAVLAERGAEARHVVRAGGHGIDESDLGAALDWLAAP